MRFEWHEAKNRLNRRKHRVSFEIAQRVFDDPFALMLIDETIDGEERWRAIGRAGSELVLVVAYSQADDLRRGRPHHLGAPSPFLRAVPI